MKLVFIALTTALSLQALASSAQEEVITLVKKELQAQPYKSQISVSAMTYLGVNNKRYQVLVEYKKQFCGDEDFACVTYKCASIAEVDSDAVVEMDIEQNPAKCARR